MRRWAGRIARRLRPEDGVTLIELLWYMVLGLIVTTAGLAFMITTLHQNNAVNSRAVATRSAEVALEQLSRDLSQAMTTSESSSALTPTVSSSGSTTTFSFSIPTPGSDTTPENVSWSCSGSTSAPGWCTRTIGSTTHQWIVGYESLAFTNSAGTALSLPITNPEYLGITMKVQVTSQLDAYQFTSTSHTCVNDATGAASTGTSPCSYTGSSNPIVVQAGVDLRNET